MEPEALTEVPEPLKKLLRYIVKGFYGLEQALLVEMLIRNACMKEDDLIELLKFDRKQLRAHVNTLKNEHFLKTRMRVETEADGKTTKHNYYFINYTGFVNVVKYKLDHVRRKLEMQERDSTRRASFQCTVCEKSYTDLEADRLFDPATGQFLCMMCQSDLKEEQSAAPVKDARTLITRFNDQIAPIYELLKQCEDYKLSRHILEPEPTVLADITASERKPAHAGAQRAARGEKGVWSGDATKNIDYSFVESTVTVNIGSSDDGGAGRSGLEKKPAKERPVWMVESTVDGVTRLPEDDSPASTAEAGALSRVGSGAAAAASVPMLPSTDIMQTLLVHEKKSSINKPAASSATAASALHDRTADSDSSSSSDDEPTSAAKLSLHYVGGGTEAQLMESEEEEEDVLIKVGDRSIPFNEVNAELVALMTPEEKEHYIKVSQDMYSKLFD